MLSFIIPFYGIKEIIQTKKNIIKNLIATLVALILYISYYIGIILLFSYIVNKELFGSLPICNKEITRAFIINGFVFPLCTRCTAITLSVFLCMPFLFFSSIKTNKIIFIISIIFIIIGFLDGFLQYYLNIESNNIRRVITGMLAGIGIAYFIYYIFNLIKLYKHKG